MAKRQETGVRSCSCIGCPLRFAANGLLVASSRADVAELADALDSKSSTGNSVWVRSPPSASAVTTRVARLERILAHVAW